MNVTEEKKLRDIIERLRDKARRKVPPSDVEDLVQEVLVVLVERMQRSQPIDSLQAYADGVLRHVIYDYYQRKREQLLPNHEVGREQVSSAPTPEQRVVWMRHLRVIENLAEENSIDLALVQDHFKNDVPLHEVASHLDVSAGAVNGRLFRFRQKVLKYAGNCFSWFLALCSHLWQRTAEASSWLRPSSTSLSSMTSIALVTTGVFSIWVLSPLSSMSLSSSPHTSSSSSIWASTFSSKPQTLSFQAQQVHPQIHQSHRLAPVPAQLLATSDYPSAPSRSVTFLHPSIQSSVQSSVIADPGTTTAVKPQVQGALSALLPKTVIAQDVKVDAVQTASLTQALGGQENSLAQIVRAVQPLPQGESQAPSISTKTTLSSPSASGQLPQTVRSPGLLLDTGTSTGTSSADIQPSQAQGSGAVPWNGTTSVSSRAQTNLSGSAWAASPSVPSEKTAEKTSTIPSKTSGGTSSSSSVGSRPTSPSLPVDAHRPNTEHKPTITGRTVLQGISLGSSLLQGTSARLGTSVASNQVALPERHSFCLVQDGRLYRCDSGRMEDISGDHNSGFLCQDKLCQSLIGQGPSLVITTSHKLYVVGMFHFRVSFDQGITWSTPKTIPTSQELLKASSLILNQQGELWQNTSSQWKKQREGQPSVHEVRLHLDNKQLQAEDDTGFRLSYEWQTSSTPSKSLSSMPVEQTQNTTLSPLLQTQANVLKQEPKQTPLPPKDEGSPIRKNP